MVPLITVDGNHGNHGNHASHAMHANHTNDGDDGNHGNHGNHGGLCPRRKTSSAPTARSRCWFELSTLAEGTTVVSEGSEEKEESTHKKTRNMDINIHIHENPDIYRKRNVLWFPALGAVISFLDSPVGC